MLAKKQLQGEWYHGDERKTDFINRNHFDVTDYSRDRNAMGPGIYFTRLKYQASGYAGNSGYIYTVTVDLDPKRTLTDVTKPNEQILRKFIDRCPDEELLYNYAEDLSVARMLAVELNMDSENMLEALMGLYNDLYQKDAVLFAKVMTEIGYDAFYHKVNPKYPDAIHLIVYNPLIINIVKEEHKGIKESKNNMKHIKLFENFLNEGKVLFSDNTNEYNKKEAQKAFGDLLPDGYYFTTGKTLSGRTRLQIKDKDKKLVHEFSPGLNKGISEPKELTKEMVLNAIKIK